jgi:cation diffusion facilitator CzcD-associated flavoprotein CzcO
VSVCVVGAGPSGLVALKELRAVGLDAVAFEAQSGPGGLFVFRESEGLVWDTLRLTSSVLVTQFSDFPPDTEALFWRHDEYVDYLRDYADRFDLSAHIRFDSPVTRVEPVTNGWNVQVADGPARHFDALVVCSGLHHRPYTPPIRGLETFTGAVIPSTRFRRPDVFRGLRVVCIGGGESAGDIVPQIADVAAECTVSLRRGAYFLPRFVNGVPGDYLLTRLRHGVGHGALGLLRRLAEERTPAGRPTPDEGPWQLQADPEVGRVVRSTFADTSLTRWQQFATKTSTLPESIVRGRCRLKPGIVDIQGSSVRFRDDSTADADVLVLCTGFEPPSWPFLGALSPTRGLYRQVFDPGLGARAAFVGFARPAIGSIPVISELQARWVARVFSGSCRLPGPDEMSRSIAAAEAATRARFPKDFDQLPYLVPYAEYLDSLAREIGCMPEVRDLRDPAGLLRAFYSAPFTALQYRLVGPGALPDAKRRMLELPIQDDMTDAFAATRTISSRP